MNRFLEQAKAGLSSRRYAHVLGVMDTAKALATRYRLSNEQASIAAALHDIYREMTPTELKKLADEVDLILPDDDPPTWHGPVTAARLMMDFGIGDQEIGDAIRFHTIGHPEMGSLAKLIYVADAIEPGRNFYGVDHLRRAAEMDLNLAVAVVADASLTYLIEKQLKVALPTVELRNKIWGLVDGKLRKDYNQGNKIN